jgi:uncharacterized membrane protein YqaE (UPF0057 family)
MRLLLAILFPPLAVAISGNARDLVTNVLLTLLLWLPGSVHAVIVVARYYESHDMLLSRALSHHAEN